MKSIRISLVAMIMAFSLLSLPVFAQDKDNDSDTSAMLNMAGDNLDLYAVLELFKKSKTIEAFEKSLNEGKDKDKINNLDLDMDKKVDFIKVVTEKDGNSFRFILRVDISKKESQDVAVIMVDKGKDDKVSIQIVGDEELYGKDYVIEPKGNSSVTANPAYQGVDPVTVNVPAQQVTVVQSPPVVQYVYSPAYVPYYPPYYYGFYPPWFGFATVMAVGIYRHNHYYHHHGYYGGHYHGGGNTVIVNNRNSINHYNNSRNVSNTVRNNRVGGSYGSGNRTGINNNRTNNRNTVGNNNNRGGRNDGIGSSSRPSTSDRKSSGLGNNSRPSNSTRPSASTRPSTSTRPSSGSFGSSGGGGRSMGGGGGARMGGGGGGGRRR
ncbi:MAG TPA: hypothetical protein VLC98_09185 [Phnomibacter sp.]|nr:hypothetical protein [Phnomibacter sp.]